MCTSPPTLEHIDQEQPPSPNPTTAIIQATSKFYDEYDNHITHLKQKIDVIAAKTQKSPPIPETGNVEEDFEVVFRHNSVKLTAAKAATELARYSITSTGQAAADEHDVLKVARHGGRVSSGIEINRKKSLDASEIDAALEKTAHVAETEPKTVELRDKESREPPPLPTSLPPGKVVRQSHAIHPENTKNRPTRTSIEPLILKPWQKQHEYRPMSSIIKPPKSREAEEGSTSAPILDLQFSFKPIEAGSSSDETLVEEKDVSKMLRTPTPPMLSSRSVQNLSEEHPGYGDNWTALFQSKSSDDLVMPDIDGIQKAPRAGRYKHMKSRHHEQQVSTPNLTEDLYVNLEDIKREVDSLKRVAADIDRRKAEIEIRPVVKKPLPLPRTNSETELDRASKTISFVFDPKANEFVLQEDENDGLARVGVIEKNSAMLQQQSRMVPIKTAQRVVSHEQQYRSLDNLDFREEASPKSRHKANDKSGGFFGLKRFLRRDKDKAHVEQQPVRQSVFYSDEENLMFVDDHKYEAKVVHIVDDSEEEETTVLEAKEIRQGRTTSNSLHEAYNRSLSTFGPASNGGDGGGGVSKCVGRDDDSVHCGVWLQVYRLLCVCVGLFRFTCFSFAVICLHN